MGLIAYFKRKRNENRLKCLVRLEAENLRLNALPEEKEKLSFAELLPCLKQHCIYGQMTGHCHSDRAIQLIESGCQRVFNNEDNVFSDKLEADLSGSPKDKSRYDYYSPIEVFIVINRFGVLAQNNKRLIEYIKGETDELKFI